MTYLRRVGTIIAGVFLMLHGIAHAPGALGSLKLATFEDVSFQPNLYAGAPDALVMLLGAIWVVAGLAFVSAGVGQLRQRTWAPMATLGALLVSLPLTILWYQNAVAGLVLNGVVLFGLVVRIGLGGTISRRSAAVPQVH